MNLNKRRWGKATFGGIVLAVAGILGEMMIEGGKTAQILQPAAAMIILGGTIGGIMISYPLPVVMASLKRMCQVVFDDATDLEALIQEMLDYAKKARKEGIISLDNELANIKNPFLKKSLMLAIDGTEPEELKKIMVLKMDNQSEQSLMSPCGPWRHPAHDPCKPYDEFKKRIRRGYHCPAIVQ